MFSSQQASTTTPIYSTTPNSKYKLLSGPLILDDDTAGLVIEKSLGFGMNPRSNSFSDAASLVAASQSKSAIGGFQFDSSLFEDRNGRERSATTTGIPRNGLIDIVQSNSEMKAAKTMLAIAQAAAAANAPATAAGVPAPPPPAAERCFDGNGSDTASDEEMEIHLQQQQHQAQELKNSSIAASIMQQRAAAVAAASASNQLAHSQPQPQLTHQPPPQVPVSEDDDDKPLNLSATSTATSSVTSRVYQASNQQIIDIYIDKFLNTGMVCNSNGFANPANALNAMSRTSGKSYFSFTFFASC